MSIMFAMLIATTQSHEETPGRKGVFSYMDDKYTRYAAVLSACGISLGNGRKYLTPTQIAEIFTLLDQPNALQTIEDYLEALEVLGDE